MRINTTETLQTEQAKNGPTVFFFTIFILIAAALVPARADASGDPDTFYLSVFVPQTSFVGDYTNSDRGEGTGVRLGLSTKNIVGTELVGIRSRHDFGSDKRIKFTAVMLNFKLSFPFFPVVKPYGFFGIGGYHLKNDDVTYGSNNYDHINGYQRGGGLDCFLSKYFSVNVGYTEARMRFDNPDTDRLDSVRSTARVYDLGVAVHFY